MNGDTKPIDEINQQLEDISTAKLAAAERGKTIGDYDLSTLASAAAIDRIAKETAAQRTSYPNEIIPRFKIGETDYTLISDSDNTRKMIKYDESGKVSKDSPVIPIGVNVGGGFLLAAPFDSNLPKERIPTTSTDRGMVINYPQSKSDPFILSKYSQSGIDINSAINEEAAEGIKSLYYQNKAE